MDALTIAVRAGTSFLLLASFFSFLGWYTRFGSDHIYRRNLDKLWDSLEQLTLFEVVHRFFSRLVRRSRETFAGKNHLFISIISASLIINSFSVVVILELYARIEKHESGFQYLLGAATHYGAVEVALVLTVIIVLASIPDLASLWITWRLVTHTARDSSFVRIAAHVVLDVFFSILALCWSFIIFAISERLVDFFVQSTPLRGADTVGQYFLIVFRGFSERPGLALAVGILGLNSALPTILYMLTCMLLIVCYVSPDIVRRFSSRCVFLISSDEKPLFSQLGTIVGGIAAILTAIVSLLGGTTAAKSVSGVNLPAIQHPCKIVLDSLLLHESRNWVFREFKQNSIEIYKVNNIGTGTINLRGTFGYTEFGVGDRITFWANAAANNRKCTIVRVCWHTLGG